MTLRVILIIVNLWGNICEEEDQSEDVDWRILGPEKSQNPFTRTHRFNIMAVSNGREGRKLPLFSAV